MRLLRFAITGATLSALIIIGGSGASASGSEENAALRREVDALRATVAEQDRRLKDLEARFESGSASSMPSSSETISSSDNAPSPDDLGSAITEPAPPAAGSVSSGGREGARAQIGVIFDGTYTGGRHIADDAEFRGVEVAIGAAVDPHFDLFTNLAFTPDEVAIEEGYVTAHLPWNLQARLGKELVPFGDLNTLHLHDQPQVDDPAVLTQFFGGEGINGVGGHIEWQAPFAVNPTLALTFGAYNRATGEATTTASDKDGDGNPDVTDMFLDAGVFNVRDRERGALMLGRISSFTGWGNDRHGLRLGGSWLGDENDGTGATRTNVYGVDAKYRWTPDGTGRGVVIAGEYLQQKRRESPTTLFLANGGNNLSNHGGYVYGQYNFDKRWSLGYRYDNTNTTFSSAREITSNSVYGEFRPSEFSRIRAQYRHDARNFDANGNGMTDDDADVYMLQFTHLIGWHPAHKF
jgi:hypothetical protein